jgi:uncharacterized metal-binding protein YceD (DUF177 family)
MKIDLRKLYGLKHLSIDEKIDIPSSLYSNMGVRRMDSINVKGTIEINIEDNISLDLKVNGVFIMPCSITFEDVECPFDIVIEQELEENNLKDKFYLDLLDILWENIVLEIPFKVVKEGANITNLQGEGWQLSCE